MDVLEEQVRLLKDAPQWFKEKAAKELQSVVSDYEDYLSLGAPGIFEWQMQTMERSDLATEKTYELTALFRELVAKGRMRPW